MLCADFDFELPEELVAQHPAPERTGSRLLVFDRSSGAIHHQRFLDLIDWLQTGDVLVMNDSKVWHARMHGLNPVTGGRFELLLLEENGPNDWWVMMKPGRRARLGTWIHLHHPRLPLDAVRGQVTDINSEGHRRIRFQGITNIVEALEEMGEVPLPPYIRRKPGHQGVEDAERYQTVVARHGGSVAAPTAGLHFSLEFLQRLKTKGVALCFVTLHVGLGTFAPVKASQLDQHVMHEERFSISDETIRQIQQAKKTQRRILAVGTTTVRVLESVARTHDGALRACDGKTNIFIYPPCHFRVVDALLTNFHLPRSTLLMLVSAFASPGHVSGRERLLAVYREAVRERYRFYSYGDCMLVV